MRKIQFTLLMLIVLVSCKKNENGSTIVYRDDLTIDKKTWTCDSTSAHVRKFYQGHYLLRVDTIPNIISYSFAPFGTLNYPYSVKVDAMIQNNSTDMTGHIGIIFNRVDKSNYCILELAGNGTYRIWQRANGQITNIITSTFSTSINSGNLAKNVIEVIQGKFSVQVNINNISMGSFGIPMPGTFFQVGVSTSTNYTAVTGLFNNFSIEKL